MEVLHALVWSDKSEQWVGSFSQADKVVTVATAVACRLDLALAKFGKIVAKVNPAKIKI
jgi:hypothetical protein